MKDIYTKFNVGDEVVITKSGEKGVIQEVQSYLGVGDNVYVVNVGDSERLYVESYLEETEIKVEEEAPDKDKEFLDEIDDKINSIIEELDLKESNMLEVQLTNICKLQRYLAVREEDEELEKKVVNISSVVVNELYQGLINGSSNYISNAYMFNQILARVGIEALNVGCKDENGNFYMTNLVYVYDKYYYFDVTLEQEIYREEVIDPDDFELCCAGLGKDDYEQFFTPLCVLEYSENVTKNELPSNIASRNLDLDYLNKLIGIE